MALSSLQLQILQILGPTMRQHGFALGGGGALIAYHAVNRITTDLDHYSKSEDPSVYEALEQDIVSQLAHHGFDTRVVRSLDWFRQINIVDPEERLSSPWIAESCISQNQP